MFRDAYNANRVKDLTKAQLMDVARSLHFDYHSSNGQIRCVKQPFLRTRRGREGPGKGLDLFGQVGEAGGTG